MLLRTKNALLVKESFQTFETLPQLITQGKTWKKRQEDIEQSWKNSRSHLLEEFVKQQPFSSRICNLCKNFQREFGHTVHDM